MQGCHFHCKNCFNQSTWDFVEGKDWTDDKENNFFKLIDRPYIKRVSILGGEPLADQNVSDVHRIIRQIRLLHGNEKTIWLYSGYYWSELHDLYPDKFEVVKLCDVLVDGRYIDELKDPSYSWAGSINQSVIDVQKSLKSEYPILWKSEVKHENHK